MFCPHCGKELSDLADICVGCGRSVKKITSPTGNDSSSVGWWWLGFLFPFIGFILWAVWTGETPVKAKKAGMGALVGVIVSVVLIALIYIIAFALSFLVGIYALDSIFYF